MKIPVATNDRPDLLPEGTYRARLGSAEAATSQKGNPMVRIVWQVTAPKDHRGAEVRDYATFTESAFFYVEKVAKAMGVELPAGGETVDPVELSDRFAGELFDRSRQGVEVALKVEHDTHPEWGTKPQVKTVLKLSDAQAKDVPPDLPAEDPVPEPVATGGDDDDIPFRAEPARTWEDVKGTTWAL